MDESELRDRLAPNMGVLEAGLTLFDKEKYIPNSLGTRGFVDLYARDAAGLHVLVEVKRSNASAREALHEIQKYVEGAKSYLGCKDGEIRVIIASTEWAELLVPYSRFVSDTSITVTGLEVRVDAHTGELEAQRVIPLAITGGRCLAPWQELNYYRTEASLQRGIAEYESCCKAKGIADFVLVVLDATAELMAAQEAIIGSVTEARYCLYFALQMLSKEHCMEIVSHDAALLEEVEECIEEDDEDALGYLHDYVLSLEPRPHCDRYEIGTPAKFSSLVYSEDWALREVRPYGAFARNALLSAEALVSEIGGADGSTGQKFKRSVSVSSAAQLSSARADIAACLSANLSWRAQILRVLGDIEIEHPTANLDVSIFNPSTGLMTIYLVVKSGDILQYIPGYTILVHEGQPRKLYFGMLVRTGPPTFTFRHVLDTYYEGSVEQLLMPMLWGGYESRDAEILEDVGLEYASFRCDLDRKPQLVFRLEGERWREIESAPSPSGEFDAFLGAHGQLVLNIVQKVGVRDLGGMFDLSSSEDALDEIARQQTKPAPEVRFDDVPDVCDLCGCSIDEERYMIDGARTESDGWAYMCPDCFSHGGRGIGLGIGQLYAKDALGWHLIAGGGSALEEQ